MPNENYLLVTRLPNFLSKRFGEAVATRDQSMWPYVNVFCGNHGVGTRAVELLLQPEAETVLESLHNELGGITEFQVLFRVYNIEVTPDGFHRASTIEIFDVVPITIDAKQYKRAHQYAMRRLFHGG